jgi:undecaprenyl-diphosphatase
MYKMINKKLFDGLLRDITSLGGFFFFFMLLIIVLALQEIQLFYQLLLGMILTFLAIVIIRTFYYKDRPNKEKHRTYVERIDASSFPSLHTARTIFIALVFIYYFNNNILTAVLIILALSVAYSRLYLKKHDTWDLFGGFILGLVVFWISSLI